MYSNCAPGHGLNGWGLARTQLTQPRFYSPFGLLRGMEDLHAHKHFMRSVNINLATMSRLKPQFGGLRTPLRQNYVPYGLGHCRVPKRAAARMPAPAAQSSDATPVAATAQGSTSGANPTSGTDSGMTSASPSKPSKPPLGGLFKNPLPPDLSAIAMVYFVQGIMELAVLAQTYHLKDNLHADPAQVSWFLSLAGIPWALKPLIGFVSDTVPLWGFHRRSYLLLASAAGCASYLWMSASGGDSSSSGLWGFVGAMLLASAASAVSDVVADSMVVTRARDESQESAGSLQSLCWASYAVGQVLTATMSGALVQDYGPGRVFQLTALFPLLVGLSSFLVQEERRSTNGGSAPTQLNNSSSNISVNSTPTAAFTSGSDDELQLDAVSAYAYATVPIPSGSPTAASLAAATRPYGGAPSVFACNVETASAQSAATTAVIANGSNSYSTGLVEANHTLFSNSNSHIPSHAAAEPIVLTHATADHTLQASATSHSAVMAHNSAGIGATAAAPTTGSSPASMDSSGGVSAATLSARTGQLWEAISRPDVLAPLCFLLLLSATPTADTAMFYYQTEHLHFTPSFLGQVQLAAACASFGGVLLYNTVLKKMRMRDLMLWGTLLGAVLQCGQLLLVSGVHRQWGVDDHTLVLGGSVVMDIIQNVLSMPTMVLAARLCPPGLEATMFATIMSACNVADGVRLAGGAALMSALGVTADDFTNLPFLLLICNACLLLPLPLLQQIPEKYARQESDVESDTEDAQSKQNSSGVQATGNQGVASASASDSRVAGSEASTAQHLRDVWAKLQAAVADPVSSLAKAMARGKSALAAAKAGSADRKRMLLGGVRALPTHATSIRVQSSPIRRRAHCTRGHATIKHLKRMHSGGWDGWDAPSLGSLASLSESVSGIPAVEMLAAQQDSSYSIQQQDTLSKSGRVSTSGLTVAVKRASHEQQQRKLRRRLVRCYHPQTDAPVGVPCVSSVPIHAALIGYDQPPVGAVVLEEHEDVVHSQAWGRQNA